MHGSSAARRLLAGGTVLLALAAGCSDTSGVGPARDAPAVRASSEFWSHWGDGRAEIDAYEIVTPRYGAPRRGELVLIYVTEPMDSRTWIKDDREEVPAAHRVNVLKLNRMLAFRTGIYPYSVMTSVFAPVDGLFPVRFTPAKISFTAQEWCGHVFHQVKPAADGFAEEIRSYFSAEGEASRRVSTPPGTLYEDALAIQLRELDGPFHGGRAWSGALVPSLWSARRDHRELAALPASIERAEAERDGIPVTRFTMRAGERTTTIDVERAFPRRILGWSRSDGEQARLVGTERLAYWELNRPGDETRSRQLGLHEPGAD